MKNKKVLVSALLCVCTLGISAVVGILSTKNGEFKASADSPKAVWHHYSKRNPTASQKGVREYWVQCGGGYQFEAPSDAEIVDKGTEYDLSEFADDDSRYLNYQYDENHAPLSAYDYGAGMYSTSSSEYKNWRITYLENEYDCNLYSDGGNILLWRIDLPRIDFTKYPTVTMKVTAPNWHNGNNMGPEADQLTYHTTYGGNKTEGKIVLTLTGAGVHMEFNSLEYADTLAFENTFTDNDIIHGLKSAYFYTEDLYDRYLNIGNIALSSESTTADVYSYAGDTSKISVVNGTVGLPGSTDYSIISNGYGTNDNSLAITGNANPGAAEITLPKINFNGLTKVGNVSFKFGVRNNNEKMYFGAGDDKVDLGNNSGTSQADNNNGYVNWEMIITSDIAYVHNAYENKNYITALTAGMMNGTESIVLRSGGASIYRVYLVTDFYWKLTPDYELTAPTTPVDIYSFAGDISKLSVVNGTVGLPGSTDYSIIGNGYGTDDNSLAITGNANPGAAEITLPKFNFKPYAAVGKVSITFGVRNNNEKMYFGAGDDKVDLGNNSATSQTDNNNGYVNWELVITATGAYVHNVYANQNIDVPLTEGMRSGTESIVLRSGGASIYRVYLVTDFYWHA